MNNSHLKKLTNWLVKATFLVLVAGLLLINQPNAQAQTPPAPAESTPAATTTPVTLPAPSIADNLRRLLQTNECVGCNLTGVALKDTNLQGANLEGANLYGADLERANLQGANLLGANLTGADDANLEATNLTGANIKGVIRPQGIAL